MINRFSFVVSILITLFVSTSAFAETNCVKESKLNSELGRVSNTIEKKSCIDSFKKHNPKGDKVFGEKLCKEKAKLSFKETLNGIGGGRCAEWTTTTECHRRQICKYVCVASGGAAGGMISGPVAGAGVAIGTQVCSDVCQYVNDCVEVPTCARYTAAW